MYTIGRLARTIPNVAILVVAACALVAPAQARIVPSTSAANFANQTVGTASSPLSITLTNTSTRPTTIVSVSLSVAAFSFSGLSLPMNLDPGQSATVAVTFAPLAPLPYSGTLIIARAFGSPAIINLSGTGIGAGTSQPVQTGASQLTPNVTALSFINPSVSGSTTQSVTLTSSGSSDVTITNVTVSGPEFTLGGSSTGVLASTGLILSPGETATVNVTFAPATPGSVTGSVIITSTAANSPTVIDLSGTAGTAPPPSSPTASISISWTPSTSTVVGYNTYSSTVSGGPYTALNSSPVTTTSYVDSTVESGQTYYYVVTAIDSNNVESVFSNEVSTTVP